jgi:hypothetical membrane protein
MYSTAPTQIERETGIQQLHPAGALAWAGIIGPAWFTSLVVLQGLLLPEYSHVRMPISALAAWPTGSIQDLNFLVTGSLAMIFAIALHRSVQPTPRGIVGAGLLALGGLGVALSGVFPWRMIDGVPTEPPAHAAAAILTFTATGLGLVAFSRRMSSDPRWRDRAAYTMLTGITVLVLFIVVGFFAIEAGAPFHAWTGLIQRALCAVLFTCLIVLARRIRAL